jgi:hypothetical protein
VDKDANADLFAMYHEQINKSKEPKMKVLLNTGTE